jgi:hypothetical protein
MEFSLNQGCGGVCSIWHIMRIIRWSGLTKRIPNKKCKSRSLAALGMTDWRQERNQKHIVQQGVPRRPKSGLARDDNVENSGRFQISGTMPG